MSIPASRSAATSSARAVEEELVARPRVAVDALQLREPLLLDARGRERAIERAGAAGASPGRRPRRPDRAPRLPGRDGLVAVRRARRAGAAPAPASARRRRGLHAGNAAPRLLTTSVAAVREPIDAVDLGRGGRSSCPIRSSAGFQGRRAEVLDERRVVAAVEVGRRLVEDDQGRPARGAHGRSRSAAAGRRRAGRPRRRRPSRSPSRSRSTNSAAPSRARPPPRPLVRRGGSPGRTRCSRASSPGRSAGPGGRRRSRRRTRTQVELVVRVAVGEEAALRRAGRGRGSGSRSCSCPLPFGPISATCSPGSSSRLGTREERPLPVGEADVLEADAARRRRARPAAGRAPAPRSRAAPRAGRAT